MGPAFRFSVEFPGPQESTAVRLSRLHGGSWPTGVQDGAHASTTVVSNALACFSAPTPCPDVGCQTCGMHNRQPPPYWAPEERRSWPAATVVTWTATTSM